MLQKKPKWNSGGNCKENNPLVSNLENMPKRINTTHSKITNENQKPLLNNNNVAFDSLKSKKSNKVLKTSKALAKSIIKEKPNKTPPKDWNILTTSTELKESETEEISIHTEKAVGYEMHFPTLGSEVPKVEKPDAAFSTDILSPNNIARHQSHMDTTTESSIVLHDEEKSERKVSGELEDEGKVLKSTKDFPLENKIDVPEPEKESESLEVEISDKEPEIKDEFGSKPIGFVYEELVPQMPLDSTAEDVEPEPPQLPEDAKSLMMRADTDSTAYESVFEFVSNKLLSNDAQEKTEMDFEVVEDKEEKIDVEDKREELEEEYECVWDPESEEEEEVGHEGYKLITVPIEEQEEEKLIDHHEEEIEVRKEENEFGDYKTAPIKVIIKGPQEKVKRSLVRRPIERKIQKPKRRDAQTQTDRDDQEDLRSIEENIMVESDDEDHIKTRGHGSEDLSASRSTDLTLSASRIDLIKEEIREADERKLNQNSLFREIEKNLVIVDELEKSNMYGAAINMLKKSLDAFDTRLVKHHDGNEKEISRLIAECNVELAYCYSHVTESRLAIDYARTAINLDPKNTKAMYLLGVNLMKCKDQLGGYNTLREAKKIELQPKYEKYEDLIDFEIKKFEHKLEQAESKAKLEEKPKLARPAPVEKVEIKRENLIERKKRPGVGAGVACFVGTAMTSGLASWFITKNYMNIPEEKSWIYSIGVGALIGGLSLFVWNQAKK